MELFWSLSTDPKKQAASQANLMTAYFNLCGENLIVPNEPKQEPHKIPVEDMELEEIARFMSQAPSRRRKVE